MVRICFVCLGNICRSPTAEGVMIEKIRLANLDTKVSVDSAGTNGLHNGESADSRSRKVAQSRGYDLPSISRQFVPSDFSKFDYVIGMDHSNIENLRKLAPNVSARERIHLFRDFDEHSPEGSAVQDPYYGGADGFEQVFDQCDAACEGLLKTLVRNHSL
jgi:protein-tyrosine phosphatase